MTDWWLVALLVAVGVLVALDWLTRGWNRSVRKAPPEAYAQVESLLTPTERAFWLALLDALPPGCVACPKVRMLDVVRPKARDDIRAKNGVIQKHLDFVVVEAVSSRIVAAIELDDSSHSRPSRRDRDRFVDDLFAYVGVPLIRFRTSPEYYREDVARRLAEAVPAMGRTTQSATMRSKLCR